jgi:hypothetical protein
MTTSNVTILELTRDQIINAALRKLVVLGEGQTASAAQILTAQEALNNLVAEYRTLGMSIWARKQQNITLVTGQKTYSMGVGQTINIPYPLKIYTANLLQPPAFDTKIIVNPIAFPDFELLPNGSIGVPVNYNYQPKINMGDFRVWPTPDAGVLPGTIIQITYQAPFQYFTAATDTPDFPEEWKNALVYGLAVLIADEMGVSLQIRQWLDSQAQKHLATALSAGTEEASFYIQRDWTGYGNYGNPS